MKTPGRSGTSQQGTRTLIIVEDSVSCAVTLEIALSLLAGIELACYHRAEEALARIELDSRGDCCALVTDLRLPGMDGWELVRLVRQERPAATFPILVISGDSDPRTTELAVRHGVNAYFRKPYSPVAVRRTLEELLDENHDPSLSL